ncbi:3-hydroxyacyl-CoA dehydrogenase NAD-binding domain-containing protein [Bradyrhizobium brasilense]|uniref:3-hydroxyacyl-CoA dehydrogenase NAD-binding domain-containing protein n=1 Tax=Bradyrhizobium brasilense TaxID=1419277 RepID=UPI00287758CE|nr:3-hydroxyacyl-CoA dehydrogenase NAD-binding domain-containing protein [Bradyrhizobium brasilense]MCP3419609.1 3-hydroxyacyl-CoA dehydrogenase NAD-binding domain-containing protein [Bradyrhizobium brasilense]
MSVAYEQQGGIAVVTIENPPVNALSVAVRHGLLHAVRRAVADAGVAAIIVIGAERSFVAGADIRELGKPRQPPRLTDVISELEASPKPVIAAIAGFALGGGLELALGCHFRIGTPHAQIGLPEVKIGIVPGAGGVERLPRLIGLQPALKMIVSGDPIRAARALELGLFDSLVDGDLRAEAVVFAERMIMEKRPIRRLSQMAIPGIEGNWKPLMTEARAQAEKQTRGQISPRRVIDCVENAFTLPFDKALAETMRIADDLLPSEQAKALRYFFFAERDAAKVREFGLSVRPRKIATAAVIGAGTMGGGIAMCFADSGIPVQILESSPEALERGLGIIDRNYQDMVQRGRISAEEKVRRMAHITKADGYEEIAAVDVVVEAAFEDMPIKKEIFAKLDQVLKSDATLATNTSTFDVDEIAAATRRPESVIGLHFFSPANVMKLLEIIRGKKTAKEIVATAQALAKRLSKVGVVCGVCHGFVANRSRAPFFREATFLIDEGALPQQVDKVLHDFGMPMGPFAVSDLAGIDIGWRVRRSLDATRPRDERYSPTADRLYELGRHGQKAMKGWYRYEKGGRMPLRDPEVEAVILQSSRDQGITRRPIGDDEILARCLYAAINEGTKVLDEGIALRPSDIDVMWHYGFGFPRWRGGPMYYADMIGVSKIYAAVKAFHRKHGKLWEPSPLLARMAEEGKTFSET